MPEVVSNVACTVCGCVCDDLIVTTDSGLITDVRGACHLAEPWFRAQNTFDQVPAEIDGQPSALPQAYERAAELLRNSRYPLIYGLSRSTTEGQRAATALADFLGGNIDTTASTGHAPSIVALQQVGESTCSLGEVRNRADLVIFWGSDPVRTHPRHLERYSAEPTGRFLPNGRKDRFLVVIDETHSETAKIADQFIRVEAEKNWESIWKLRMRVRGIGVEPEQSETAEAFADLARRMKACQCGVIFFGAGLTRGKLAHRTIEALLQLVTDLNQHTRFYARRMRRFGDVAGADSVLAWQTGYPFGVNFAIGYPRYNPGEFTAPEMLSRGEIDLCLIIGSETAIDFPPLALNHLNRIPIIVLDPPGVTSIVPATVKFTTAVYGIHRPGTAYRMDEVPIPLRVLLPTELPDDGEVLRELLRLVSESPS